MEQESLDPPETWDDLLAVCEQLSGSSEYSPISFPGKKGGALASIFSSLLTSNGGWYFNDAGEPNVNSAEGVEVAEFLADLPCNFVMNPLTIGRISTSCLPLIVAG